MTENVIKNIQELNDKRTKKEILSECLKEIEWNKNSLWQYVIAAVAAFVVSCCATFFSNTVEMTKTISATFLDVQLAFFAVVFGAYAIFQALMRDEIIRELIRTENNILKDSNRTFLNLSILYIGDIFITVLISLLANMCPTNFFIYSVAVSNGVFVVLAFVYCIFNFLLMLENINFVINLYRMFNVYNIYRALDISDDENIN